MAQPSARGSPILSSFKPKRSGVETKSVPLSALIGSPRRLVAAILLFVALDLTVLTINLWIAQQVAADAVAINLAGRQRMLSQRMTKALLLAAHAPDAASAQRAGREFLDAFNLFSQTLSALNHGGQTRGGDGELVTLRPVSGAARDLVEASRTRLAPIAQRVVSEDTGRGSVWPELAGYLVLHNETLLDQANRLTSLLEHDSVRRTRQLRWIQAGAFALALANFVLIVLGLARRFREAEREKIHWQDLARHDALTGLTNRKGFFEAAERILTRARHDHGDGVLLLLDLDGFKPINDLLGHPIGDAVLQAFADRLSKAARPTDVVARLGGDEFVLMCPNLNDAKVTGQLCDRVLQAIAQIERIFDPPVPMGVSIGIAAYPARGYDIDALIASADRAMYQAKRDGGNRWASATDDVAP